MTPTLSAPDLARLNDILRLAHAIERDWPRPESIPRLQELMRACSAADSPDLKRLSQWAKHLDVPENGALELRHFCAILVPFERLASRALRDDEFLILTADNHLHVPRNTALPLAVIIDNLRSAFNVGAIFRTAECLGLQEIALCGYTPTPDDAKVAKTAMGTGIDVNWRHFPRAADACEVLRSEGYQLVALETVAGAVSLHDFVFPQKTALIVGNERFGLEADILKLADGVCRIPVRGRKNSLNVGISFGIAAFEWLRQHPQ